MKANKVQPACDIAVYADKGSLALRFPRRHNALWETLDGKSLKGKPKCLGIGKYGFSADEPDDWKRANAIAVQLEADLDHPEWEKLFDPTLAKYGLGGGKYAKLAEVLQLPSAAQIVPEITVGEMWEAYLEWKKTVIEETTFKQFHSSLFSNAIYGREWNKKTRIYSQREFPVSDCRVDDNKEIIKRISVLSIFKKAYLVSELAKAFDFCKSRELLKSPTDNPFLSAIDKFNTPVVTTQQKYANKVVNGEIVEWHEIDEEKAELDRRSFSLNERDVIIKAFYESPSKNKRALAPLIEFYFLTGCRTSEAFPLTWKDVDFERNVIRFSKSLGRNTGKVKTTKTDETRLFYFNENSRLKALLLQLKGTAASGLVFPNKTGKHLSSTTVYRAWYWREVKGVLADGTEKTYYYPGIVTELVEQGLVGGYLSLYHTRHTYITLTAHANAHNNNALLYIASSCGNSVDVILRHYLGVTESVELVQV